MTARSESSVDKGWEASTNQITTKTLTTMKTRKNGNGMNHKQVVNFSNRLAYAGIQKCTNNEYLKGWHDACKYFAHQLRKELRYCEKINII